MHFEFATAQRILFGSGQLRELPILIKEMGSRAALITGTSAERIMPVFQALKTYGANPAARIVTGSRNAQCSDLSQWINDICMQMRVPGLADIGIAESDLPDIVEKSKNSSSMKGNPIALTDSELAEILGNSLAATISSND